MTLTSATGGFGGERCTSTVGPAETYKACRARIRAELQTSAGSLGVAGCLWLGR